MISPNIMVVDGLTWREVTGPGTTCRKRETVYIGGLSACQLLVEYINYSVHWYVVAVLVTLCPLPMLESAQTSTSYLVPGLSTGVVYCLCVAVLCTVLLQPPGDPLDGFSRCLSR